MLFSLSLAIIFAAGAGTVFAVAVVAHNDVVERAVFAFAVVLAGGHFAADRTVDVHFFTSFSPIMRRATAVYEQTVDFFCISLYNKEKQTKR